ncbi:hypothetical protein B0H11DRAFT_2386560 [Mycena galericulata]|nr:hypothetical protein B0H11DRAFT_2386560 [Mycena galericulata]
MLLAPLDDPVRQAWGILQANQSLRLQVGLRVDDTVVEALFAQRNTKGRHYGRQRYQPSRLSSSSSQLNKQKADIFQSSFNDAKLTWFRPGQTALSSKQDISTFVEAQEEWVKSEIGVGHAYAEATKWFVGAYAALFARWSVVSIRVIPIAGIGPRQFAIIAEEDLPGQTIIHELTGLLSSDPADGACHSDLSVMQDLDGVQRVLFGPIRLINHCCAPNARTFLVRLCATRQWSNSGYTPNNKVIQKGEEIVVSYGRGFWTEGKPCLCSVCLGPRPVPRRDEDLVQQQKTKEARRNARRRKNVAVALEARRVVALTSGGLNPRACNSGAIGHHQLVISPPPPNPRHFRHFVASRSIVKVLSAAPPFPRLLSGIVSPQRAIAIFDHTQIHAPARKKPFRAGASHSAKPKMSLSHDVTGDGTHAKIEQRTPWGDRSGGQLFRRLWSTAVTFARAGFRVGDDIENADT